MKLIFCPACHDIIKLHRSYRTCLCGNSYGYYMPNGRNARIGGLAVPIGFVNQSFVEAYKSQPEEGHGTEFIAFVMPEKCETVERM